MPNKNVAKSDPRSARNGIASSTTSISMTQVRADTATTTAISFSDKIVRDIFDKTGELPPTVSMSFFRGNSINCNFSFVPFNRPAPTGHVVGGDSGTAALEQYNVKMSYCVVRQTDALNINYGVERHLGTLDKPYKMAFRDVNGVRHISTNSHKLFDGEYVAFRFSVNTFDLLMAFSTSNKRVSFEIYAVN